MRRGLTWTDSDGTYRNSCMGLKAGRKRKRRGRSRATEMATETEASITTMMCRTRVKAVGREDPWLCTERGEEVELALEEGSRQSPHRPTLEEDPPRVALTSQLTRRDTPLCFAGRLRCRCWRRKGLSRTCRRSPVPRRGWTLRPSLPLRQLVGAAAATETTRTTPRRLRWRRLGLEWLWKAPRLPLALMHRCSPPAPQPLTTPPSSTRTTLAATRRRWPSRPRTSPRRRLWLL